MGYPNKKPRLQGGSPFHVSPSVSTQPLVVEVFAGKASFSRALLEAGFAVLSVDHQADEPQVPMVLLNLTAASGQEILWTMIKQPQVVAVHLGVPCGSASRARERPMPKHLVRAGVPCPKPLRSGVHPLGLPGLNARDQARVDSANVLCSLTLEIALHCLRHNIVVSIENPANSWTWAAFVKILNNSHSAAAKHLYNSMQPVEFHSCCHGGLRRKATKWLSTLGVYAALQAVCQNDHEHAPFGVTRSESGWQFDTSLEAAYPKLLAQRATACLATWVAQRGKVLGQPARVQRSVNRLPGATNETAPTNCARVQIRCRTPSGRQAGRIRQSALTSSKGGQRAGGECF